MSQDFNIKVTVRNARLLRAIRKDFESAAAFARFAGVSQSQVTALVTMRDRPFKKDGNLTAAAEAIVSALGVPADDLWPDHIRRLKAKKATVEIEMDAQTFAEIAADDPEQRVIYRQAITKWSGNLSDREKDILCMRADGATYEEVAKADGASKERVRQVEWRAMRKMREAAKRDGVKDFQGLVG